MKLEACNIINEMLKNVETVRLFTELAPIPELLAIIVDQDFSWELIGAALGVFHNLTKFSADMAYIVAKQPIRVSQTRFWDLATNFDGIMPFTMS